MRFGQAAVMTLAVPPARWQWHEGTAFAPAFGDVYHSRAGALGQAHAVFLAGVGLPQRWRARRHFAILETGFGFGVNFLATWHAWQSDPGRCETLDYVAFERHPVTPEDWQAFWGSAETSLATLASACLEQYPPLVAGWHRLWLEDGRVRLTLIWGDIRTELPKLHGFFDAVYLDGFAPAKNPEMWSAEVLSTLRRHLAAGAQLASWCVAAAVRRTLSQFGLAVERLPGFGGKRERLVAVAPARGAPRREAPRTVAVVGAGLAGAAVARALAERGIAVAVFEAGPSPATGASGNPAGAARWLPSRDDNLIAQWTRLGLMSLLRRWPRWQALGAQGHWCGAAHIARNDAQTQRQQSIVAQLGLPRQWLTWDEAAALTARVGVPVARGGWWCECAGWVVPATLVRAWLSHDAIAVHTGARVCSLEPLAAPCWRLAWEQNGTIGQAEFEAVVLATGAAAAHGWPEGTITLGGAPQAPLSLPLSAVRGQVSWCAVPASILPRAVLAGSGYVVPTPQGELLFGATAQANDFDATVRADDHRENVARLARMAPGLSAVLPAPTTWQGRVGWRALAHDHLPVVGALARSRRWDDPRRWGSGLFVLNGLGARGVSFAALAGELLAAQICDEPWPVPQTLARAVDPARWARRRDLLNSTHFDPEGN